MLDTFYFSLSEAFGPHELAFTLVKDSFCSRERRYSRSVRLNGNERSRLVVINKSTGIFPSDGCDTVPSPFVFHGDHEVGPVTGPFAGENLARDIFFMQSLHD